MKIETLFNLSDLNLQEKRALARIVRLSIYFFILLFLVLGLWVMAKYYGIYTFLEGGIVENLQLILLLVSSLIFLKEALHNEPYSPLLFFFANLTTFAFIREQDSFFEKLIPIVSWKFAWFLPLFGAWNLFRKPKNFRKIFFPFLDSSAFQLMFIAMVVFIPFAQCIGHRSFIVDSIGTSDNMTIIRRFVEETMELMAYTLILLSSIEIHFELTKKKIN